MNTNIRTHLTVHYMHQSVSQSVSQGDLVITSQKRWAAESDTTYCSTYVRTYAQDSNSATMAALLPFNWSRTKLSTHCCTYDDRANIPLMRFEKLDSRFRILTDRQQQQPDVIIWFALVLIWNQFLPRAQPRKMIIIRSDEAQYECSNNRRDQIRNYISGAKNQELGKEWKERRKTFDINSITLTLTWLVLC